MENDFDLNLGDRESFRIDPEVWLHTLLAITGDQQKKQVVIRHISQETGFSPEDVELIISTTISILIQETRSN